tara:strand:+ start:382 stop:3435 length:3054 start_codon:yes stop_codon:yes gene_type:complete
MSRTAKSALTIYDVSDGSSPSFARYYSTFPGLLSEMGDPTTPGTGVTWTLATGTVPNTAYWIAERYTIAGGTPSAWQLMPVQAKESGIPFVTGSKGGFNMPTLGSATWITDAVAAVSSFTGRTYTNQKEFGYGTTVVITYANGKLSGRYIRSGSSDTWVAPATFIDGDLIVDGTISASHIQANAIDATKLVVTGTNAVTAATVGADTAGSAAAAEAASDASGSAATALADAKVDATTKVAVVTNNIYTTGTTTIDGGNITTDSITAVQIDANAINTTHLVVSGTNAITASTVGAATTAENATAATTANWSTVTDDNSNMPDNNATLGATWGTDLSGQPSDTALLNANTTPSDIGYTGDLAATAGATWGTDISSQPSDNRLFNNLLDSESWVVGSSGSQTGFNQNGSTAENSIILGLGPKGETKPLWQGDSISGNADGGWNSDTIPIDHTKSYRQSVWIKRSHATDGVSYLGCHGSSTNNMGGTSNTNPYHWNGDLPTTNKWYLVVGMIHGSGYSSTAQSGISGVYDPDTGARVIAGYDFKNKTTATAQQQRAYLYYSATNGNQAWFSDPRFELILSNTPSIISLMNADAVTNKVITDNIYTTGTTTIDGGNITTGSITSAKITVNDNITFDSGASGLIFGKTSLNDGTPGAFYGRGLDASGAAVAGFSISSTNSSLLMDSGGNFRMVNVGIFTGSPGTPQSFLSPSNNGSSTHIYNLPSGLTDLDIVVQGGGGGGSTNAAGDRPYQNSGATGGLSSVKCYSGANGTGSLLSTISSAGGTGAAWSVQTNLNTGVGAAGAASAGAVGGFGGPIPASTGAPSYPGNGSLGSGGGSGGAWGANGSADAVTNNGGGAGGNKNVSSVPSGTGSLILVVGAGGLGGAGGTSNASIITSGGNGGSGYIIITNPLGGGNEIDLGQMETDLAALTTGAAPSWNYQGSATAYSGSITTSWGSGSGWYTIKGGIGNKHNDNPALQSHVLDNRPWRTYFTGTPTCNGQYQQNQNTSSYSYTTPFYWYKEF